MAKYTTGELASQVLDGKWGSGKKRVRKLTEAGYDYDRVQTRVNRLLRIRKKMRIYAKSCVGKFKYVRYNSKDAKTKTCPICKGRKKGDHYGGNCIWGSFQIWKHGGGLDIRCNCHVIDNATWEKLLTVSDKKAVEIVEDLIGIKGLMVIRNNGKKIPSKKLQSGDICGCYINGNKYKHTIFYMGDGKVADCTSGRTPNFKADARLTSYQKKMPIKLAIRYVGDDD